MLPPDISQIFHPALIDCMTGGRTPEQHEIEAMAERIWSDLNGVSAPVAWCDLLEDSSDRRRAIAAAQMAFGMHAGSARPVSVDSTRSRRIAARP